MKTKLTTLFLIFSLIVSAQSRTSEMSGTNTFIIQCNKMEMASQGETFSKMFDVEALISFTPGEITKTGILIMNIDGDKQYCNVRGIHEASKDGKTYYTGVDSDDPRCIYVWRENYFFFTDGKHSAEFTLK